jgi:hypothetical protein
VTCHGTAGPRGVLLYGALADAMQVQLLRRYNARRPAATPAEKIGKVAKDPKTMTPAEKARWNHREWKRELREEREAKKAAAAAEQSRV